MKKCTYCGKEYSDDTAQCLIDGQPLEGEELRVGAEKETLTFAGPITMPEATAPSRSRLTDRTLRIVEVTLVCAIAFNAGILSSFYFLWDPAVHIGGSGPVKWVFGTIREGLVLVLLWYVLLRNSKTFSDIGFKWRWKHDIGWSIVLKIAGSVAFSAIYGAIYLLRLTSSTRAHTSSTVGHYLFYGGITFATIVYQFVNPFFEELIVRAYLMTEVKALTNSAAKAILISTVLQTSYHFYQGVPAALAHAGEFLIFSIYFAKTNRIAPVILAHLYADVAGTLWYLFHN